VRARAAATAALSLTVLLGACGGPARTVAAGDGTPAAGCAAGSVSGQGSSAQTGALHTWIKRYQVACPDAAVSYASVGSGAGVRAFLAGTGDFAGSDSPLTGADAARAAQRCGGAPVVHLPLVAGPVALAYNVAGVDALRLRPATVAAMLSGVATRWNDPLIAADNPGVALPATPVRPVHRSDRSGTTDNVTRFLAATAGPAWRFGGGSTWPAPGGTAAKGSTGVSAVVARTDGAIGYVEASYARFHHLAVARIGNGAGEYAELTDAAVTRAVDEARIPGTGGDLRLELDHATTAAGAYPLVLVTYEIVCGARVPPLLKSFLAYAASEAGQRDVARLGYTPLPTGLRSRVATAVAGLG